MKAAAITVALVTLTAGGALAANAVSDMDYLKASRCKGLAESAGDATVDAKALNTFLKAESYKRHAVVVERGDAEALRGKREGKSPYARERVMAELSGPCAAYLSDAKAMANRQSEMTAPR